MDASSRLVTADSRIRRIMRMVVFTLSTAAAWLAAVCLLAWLTGRIVSDRYLWSQFLLWIPTPVAIGVAALGLTASLRRGKNGTTKRWRRIRWLTVIATLMIYFGFVEHRMLRTPPAAHTGLHIVHWNAWPDQRESTDKFLDGVLALDPDILILSNAWGFPWWQQSRDWVQQQGGVVRSMRPFAIISRVPLITARHLVSADEITITLLEFDTTDQLGRTLTMYAVDMPSDLKLVRLDVARQARRLLDEAEQPDEDDGDPAQSPGDSVARLSPDLVVGDFNITRNSAAMRTMFPDMRHAFHEAGHGYGASFFRIFPLYHVDHTLLGDSVRATRYDIIDPGVSRHRVQSVRIVPNE